MAGRGPRAVLALGLAVLPGLASPLGAQLRSEVVVTGLPQLVGFVADPADPAAFFLVQQSGVVRVLRNGALLATPFLDLSGAVSTGGERGLLGLAFPPDAATSGRFFVNFTNPAGDTVVARFRRSANPLVADPASRFDLRWPDGARFIRQPYSNHNGGHLAFGPDGHLYIGLGDGGSGNDPINAGQDPATLLGKMLRIDVRVPDSDAAGYRVPADNPFAAGQPVAALSEIWAFGLRNPWRYAFDDVARGGTGALIVADVGQGAREEVNYEPPGRGGRNYGWRLREGRIATPGVPATPAAFTPLTDPLFDYPRDVGRSVTGGFVYRGSALGAGYQGRYFVADYVTGRVWSVGLAVGAGGEAAVTDVLEHTAELQPLGFISSFGVDVNGELYLVLYSTQAAAGRVVRIAPDIQGAPAAPALAADVSGSTVTLTWQPGVGGAAPTGFRLEAGSRSGAADLAVVDVGAGERSVVARAVGRGVYYVRIRALRGATSGPPSAEIVVTIP
ncbi:MAG: PQQ-dependent sugar dehydrogenase [Acidobacteriota bacterium]